MSEHLYPWRALLPDYLRAGGGLAFSIGAMPMLGEGVWMYGLFGGLALLFGGFAASTVARHRSVTTVDDGGIAMRGLRSAAIPWDAVEQVKVKYYSTKRDRTSGWMQLEVRGAGRRVSVDSTIDDFEGIAARVVAEARTRGVGFDPTSATNLAALGLGLGDVP